MIEMLNLAYEMVFLLRGMWFETISFFIKVANFSYYIFICYP